MKNDQAKELEKLLLGVIATIMQKSHRHIRKTIMGAVAGKLSATAATMGATSLVGAFGTASTGTAISTLSGAAANTATLYWFGTLVGGGVVAGGVMLTTGGIGAAVVTGYAAKRMMDGKPRKMEDLEPFEAEIVRLATVMACAIRQDIDKGHVLTASEMRLVANHGIHPLVDQIENHRPEINTSLTASRHRKLDSCVAGLRKMTAGHDHPVLRSAAVVIAVTLQRLVDDVGRSWALEESLVLDALRRSNASLQNATVDELAAHVTAMSPEQLRGLAANVKGIYHELLFANAENADGDAVRARVFEVTNHPGADVEFMVSGNVVSEVQLKATASPELINEHLAKYPDIAVLATEEVAARMEGVEGSGFSNERLAEEVNAVLDDLDGDSLLASISDGAAVATLVAGLAAGKAARSGQPTRHQLASAGKDIAIGAITAVALTGLFGI